jgi:hypothetical protein
VSVHWDWICDVLTGTQAASLRTATTNLLSLVNRALGEPAIARALEPVPARRRVIDLR